MARDATELTNYLTILRVKNVLITNVISSIGGHDVKNAASFIGLLFNQPHLLRCDQFRDPIW